LTIPCTARLMEKKIRQSLRAVASWHALNPDLPSQTISVVHFWEICELRRM
jgi:hypothetical protein